MTAEEKDAVASLKAGYDSSASSYLRYDKKDDQNNHHFLTNKKFNKPELFYFDPNTLSTEGWMKLGVREKTAAGIQKYISKGGRFRKPEDILKIWGLFDDQKEMLLPFVRINQEENKTAFENTKPLYEKKYFKKEISSIDINSADSTAFDNLPGIGAGYARRIINFRKKLGGFYSADQVAETFGLPDSVFQKIKPFLKADPASVQKININTATEDELKSHPYIRWQLAKVITEFKKQHGSFKSASDLKKIMIIKDEDVQRLSPYLEF